LGVLKLKKKLKKRAPTPAVALEEEEGLSKLRFINSLIKTWAGLCWLWSKVSRRISRFGTGAQAIIVDTGLKGTTDKGRCAQIEKNISDFYGMLFSSHPCLAVFIGGSIFPGGD
jgi:hypothetical protein